MTRVYYNSEPGDGPKIVEHGGKNLVWFPKGEHYAWKKDAVLKTFEDQRTKKMVEIKGKKLVKVAGKKGRSISFLDLDRETVQVVMLQKNNADHKLMVEADYFKIAGIDDLDIQIEQLKALKAEKEAEKMPPREPEKKPK